MAKVLKLGTDLKRNNFEKLIKKKVKKTILFSGQGSQYKGMGEKLFLEYPRTTELASEILGYSIKQLCLENPNNKLQSTQYAQPALYLVNALGYFQKRDDRNSDLPVDLLMGHSLGEYNALLAAEAFDFETGLQLVQKRGELMSQVSQGGMAAILGIDAEAIQKILIDRHLDTIDLANYNTPTQTIISGSTTDIGKAEKIFTAKNIKFIILNVSTPFHSRYMQTIQQEFSLFLQKFSLQDPKITTIANSTARSYEKGKVLQTLSQQISSSVMWTKSIQYAIEQGNREFIEINSTILTKMVTEIQTAGQA